MALCEDAPCCGCCGPDAYAPDAPEDFADLVCDCPACDAGDECDCACDAPDCDESMDGDHASALTSAGFGCDEDYGDWGGGDEF